MGIINTNEYSKEDYHQDFEEDDEDAQHGCYYNLFYFFIQYEGFILRVLGLWRGMEQIIGRRVNGISGIDNELLIIIELIILDISLMKVNQQQSKKIDSDARGNPLMTLKTIKYFCNKDSLFDTPELNEKLYLHYKGFKKIDSMQHYPNLITIWLSNNCIARIEGLHSLRKLICLYLNNNAISRIENLEGLDHLSILHLAHNRIDKIEGLGCLKSLNWLNLAENFLNSPESIIGLREAHTLTSVDLSKNQLESSDELFEVVSSLPRISCLSMKNTPISRVFKNYRKRLIAGLKQLKYLDDRPVKDTEHRLAEAWVMGGAALENQQKIKIANQVSEKNQRENCQLNNRISREKVRLSKIQELQTTKKQLEKQQSTCQTIEQLQQIKNQLQILKSGPKGFQASITKTSIRVLNVSEEEQQETINRYFRNEKMEIEGNLKKMEQEAVGICEVDLGQQEKQISDKVCQILDINVGEGCEGGKRWNQKYDKILQALLIKEKFNFAMVLPQFNRIVSNIDLKMMRVTSKWNQRQIEKVWTEIEIKRRGRKYQ